MTTSWWALLQSEGGLASVRVTENVLSVMTGAFRPERVTEESGTDELSIGAADAIGLHGQQRPSGRFVRTGSMAAALEQDHVRSPARRIHGERGGSSLAECNGRIGAEPDLLQHAREEPGGLLVRKRHGGGEHG